MEYKSPDIQKIFGISYETVRQWCKEFKGSLSPDANPPKGQHRHFTDEDLLVFSYVEDCRRRGMTNDQVREHLALGNRGDMPAITSTDPRALASDLDDANERISVLVRDINQLVRQRDQVVAQNEALEKALEYERGRAEEYADKINLLNREIGKLQARLEILSED